MQLSLALAPCRSLMWLVLSWQQRLSRIDAQLQVVLFCYTAICICISCLASLISMLHHLHGTCCGQHASCRCDLTQATTCTWNSFCAKHAVM